jgi:DNA excision repair protein ERCC-2
LGSGREEFFVTWQPQNGQGTIKITCADASESLASCYDRFESVVGFSATLRPFEYYAKLSGLSGPRLKEAEFQSPFKKENRKILVIPQVSTKYSARDKNYSKIAEGIHRISAVRRGNYLAFFPSFHFMEKVLECFTPPEGFTLVKQARDMAVSEQLEVLENLRSGDEAFILFSVQGGVFSEGIDFVGDAAIGVFVVGTALPVFEAEREMMRAYYEKKYGQGFNYAYVYPAMSKAVQAAGRVIRSETDRGVIILMDERFLVSTYSDTLPRDWFAQNPRELVSQAILKDLSHFWQEND